MKKEILIVLFSVYCLNAYFQQKTTTPQMKGVTTNEYYDRAKTKLKHTITEYPDGTQYLKFYNENGTLYEEGLAYNLQYYSNKTYDKFGKLVFSYNYNKDWKLDGESTLYDYVPDFSKTYLKNYALSKAGELIVAKHFYANGKLALLYQNDCYIEYDDKGRELINIKFQKLPNDIIRVQQNINLPNEGVLGRRVIKIKSGNILEYIFEKFDSKGKLTNKEFLEIDSISNFHTYSSIENEKYIYKAKVKYPNYIDKSNNFKPVVKNVDNNSGHVIVFPELYDFFDEKNKLDILDEINSSKYIVEKLVTNSQILKIDLDYTNIPDGEFIMGSPINEIGNDKSESQHKVKMSKFRITKHEITNQQFATFLNIKAIDANGYEGKNYEGKELVRQLSVIYDGSKWIPKEGLEDYPVIGITWYGASEFAKYVGGNLPTEAQWEYACRAGTTTPFNTGDCIDKTQANFNWNTKFGNCSIINEIPPKAPLKVGSFLPNAFGLYDMHGNVWEWCADWFSIYPNDEQNDPIGPSTGTDKVIRGGGYRTEIQYCRSALRNYDTPESIGIDIGFRVVIK